MMRLNRIIGKSASLPGACTATLINCLLRFHYEIQIDSASEPLLLTRIKSHLLLELLLRIVSNYHHNRHRQHHQQCRPRSLLSNPMAVVVASKGDNENVCSLFVPLLAVVTERQYHHLLLLVITSPHSPACLELVLIVAPVP